MLLIFAVALSALGVLAEDKQTGNGTCTRSEVFNVTHEYHEGEDLVNDHKTAREELAKVFKNLNFATYRRINLEAVNLREGSNTLTLKRLSLYNKAGATKLQVEYIITKKENSSKLSIVPSGTLKNKLKECKKVTNLIYGSRISSKFMDSEAMIRKDDNGVENTNVYPSVFQKEEKEDPGTQVKTEDSGQPYIRNLRLESPTLSSYSMKRHKLDRSHPNAGWIISRQTQQPRGRSNDSQTASASLPGPSTDRVIGLSGKHENSYDQQKLKDNPDSKKISITIPWSPAGETRNINRQILANAVNASSSNTYVSSSNGNPPNRSGTPDTAIWRVGVNQSRTAISSKAGNTRIGGNDNGKMLFQKKPGRSQQLQQASSISWPKTANIRRRKFKSGKILIPEPVIPRPAKGTLNIVTSGVTGGVSPSLSSLNSIPTVQSDRTAVPKPIAAGPTNGSLNIITKRIGGYRINQPSSLPLSSLNTLQTGYGNGRVLSLKTAASPTTVTFNITTSRLGGHNVSQLLSSLLSPLNSTSTVRSRKVIISNPNIAGAYGIKQILLSKAVSALPASGTLNVIASSVTGDDAHKPLSMSPMNVVNTIQKGYRSSHTFIPRTIVAGPASGTLNIVTKRINGYGINQSSSSSLNTIQTGYGSSFTLIPKSVIGDPASITLNITTSRLGSYNISQLLSSLLSRLNTTSIVQHKRVVISNPSTTGGYGVKQILLPKAFSPSGTLSIVASSVVGDVAHKPSSFGLMNVTNTVQTRDGNGQILLPKPITANLSSDILNVVTSRTAGRAVNQPIWSSLKTLNTTNAIRSGQTLISKPVIVGGYGIRHILVPKPVIVARYGIGQILVPGAESAGRRSGAINIVTSKVTETGFGKPSSPSSLSTASVAQDGYGIGQFVIPNPLSTGSANGGLNITTSNIGKHVLQPSLPSLSSVSTNIFQSGQTPIPKPVVVGPPSGTLNVVSAARPYSMNLISTSNITQSANGNGHIRIATPTAVSPTTVTSNISTPKTSGCGVSQPSQAKSSNSKTTAGNGGGSSVIIIPIIQPVIPSPVAIIPVSNSPNEINSGSGRHYINRPCSLHPFRKPGIVPAECGNSQTVGSRATTSEYVNGIQYVTSSKAAEYGNSHPRPLFPYGALKTKQINPSGTENVRITNYGVAKRDPFIITSGIYSYDKEQPWHLSSSSTAKVASLDDQSMKSMADTSESRYVPGTSSSASARYELGRPWSLFSSSTARNPPLRRGSSQSANRRLTATGQTDDISAIIFSGAGKHRARQASPSNPPFLIKIESSASGTNRPVLSRSALAGSPSTVYRSSPSIIISGLSGYGISLSSPSHSIRASKITPTLYGHSKLRNTKVAADGMNQNYRILQNLPVRF